MLSENPLTERAGKFAKYMLYALGENVLVVIGILFALSINSRNDNRKDMVFKRDILRLTSVHSNVVTPGCTVVLYNDR